MARRNPRRKLVTDVLWSTTGGHIDRPHLTAGSSLRRRETPLLVYGLRFVLEVDVIVPSKAWERGMRCKDATLKPFVGTLRVESPSGSA